LRVLPRPLCCGVPRPECLSGGRGVARALSYKAALPALDGAQRPNSASGRIRADSVALRAGRSSPCRGRDEQAAARPDAHSPGVGAAPPACSTSRGAHAVRYCTAAEALLGGRLLAQPPVLTVARM